jgi:hypothetical protein
MAKSSPKVASAAISTDSSTTSNWIEEFKKEAEKIITGRVEPRIYAFITKYVPKALKVGDTYRPVKVRLEEWKKYYDDILPSSPVLEKLALANPNNPNDFTYFRDYSVHEYLESINKYRLQPKNFSSNVYQSNEFFRDTSKKEIEAAIKDIQNAYKNKTRQYQFYTEQGLPAKTTIKRDENYSPRDIQQQAIDKFKTVYQQRKNLLMYAVMRFGKSFTAMCCAEQMGARVVVIVSAKKDVKEAWYQIVMGHKKFDGYEFFDADTLFGDPNAISKHLKNNKKNKAAIFLTLQDLSGKDSNGNSIKEKHTELFDGTVKIDLLIVDETHFGARAEQYGKVLQDPKYIKDTTKGKKLDDDDFVETEEGAEAVKVFNATVKLHLSGTPYRILMGSEFEKEDIVAFFQYSDIVAKKKEWDDKNIEKDEWENPYYGFPEMVRFAFNPNESSRKVLEQLRKNGYTYALSALLKPKSVQHDLTGDYQKFVYEKEVLDFLQVIDGKKLDDQLFGFLNYDKLKEEGKMCRHIVMVLPYKASCDAMQKLINDNKKKFKNLKHYNIINISGVEVNNCKDVLKCSTIDKGITGYSVKKDNLVGTVRSIITTCENAGQKTLTLTVNRMLTGCTVPEWDTMLYMKDTSSPQEYDQAIFRLQNPYTKTYIHPEEDENGKPVLDKNGKQIIKKIKKDMKPQTLLVDFDPMRLFLLQEHKAQIYNVNTEKIGNSELKDRIEKELEISPLLTIDPVSGIVKVNAAHILDKVSQYHYDRGIREEVDEIPIDMGLFENESFRDTIAKENEIGSKSGLAFPANEGEETDPNIEPVDDKATGTSNGNTPATTTENNQPSEEKVWEKKLKSYFVKILLYAYLTDDNVSNLHDIVAGIDNKDDNKRIAKHLGLEKGILQILLGNIKRLGHFEMISVLDYKIQDLNKLSHNKGLSVEKQVEVALCKFGKLGDAMVITPANIADDMMALLPDNFLRETANKDGRMLDIAATSGEFAMALYHRMKDLKIKEDIIKNSIYSIPKSSICYELTRKIYKLLGLNFENIAEQFDAFDLLKVKDNKNNIDCNKIKQLLGQKKKFSEITLKEEITIQNKNTMIEFNAIVGNPPYQKKATGDANGSDPIYHLFIDTACALGDKVTFIHPAKFLFNAGKTPKDWNVKMLNDEHYKVIDYWANCADVFPIVNVEGGIAVSLWDKHNNFGKIGTFVPYKLLQSTLKKVLTEKDFKSFTELVYPRDLYRLTDILYKENPGAENRQSKGHKYDVGSSVFKKFPDLFYDKNQYGGCKYVQIYGRENNVRVLKWIKKEYLDVPDNFNSYKIFIPKSNGSGAIGKSQSTQMIGEPTLGAPNVGTTTTFLCIGNFNKKEEAEACMKYIKTKFVRALLGTLKVTPDNPRETWANVPLQDFTSNSKINWKKSIKDIDQYLYKKYKLSKDEIEFIEKMIKPMK